MNRFDGKVAIVTGGGNGIGRSIATRMASEGCRVVIADLDEAAAKKVVSDISKAGGRASSFKVDISKGEQVEKTVAGCLAEFGQIDILVNNAAMHGKDVEVDFFDSREDFIDRILSVNVKGAVLFSQAVLRHMVERKYGKIVNMASSTGLVASEWGIMYGTSKGAVISLSRNLARKFAPFNININCICPGITLTGHSPFSPERQAEQYKKIVQEIPIGKPGMPEDVAAMALFLCSDDARHVVGQTISVDGGAHRI